jgi:hypothetical protein
VPIAWAVFATASAERSFQVAREPRGKSSASDNLRFWVAD